MLWIDDLAVDWERMTMTHLIDIQRMLEAAGIKTGDNVLDLGCATGILAIIAKAVSVSGRVVGIDASPRMISVASDIEKQDRPAKITCASFINRHYH